MSLFRRIKNIIKSNISDIDEPEIDLDNYKEVYYSDSKDIPKTNVKEEEYYKILELENGAGFDEIKKSYRRLLKKYHPDLFQNDSKKLEIAKKVTTQINEAYTYFERKYL